MLQIGDKVLVCHRDWLPDGRIIKREADVFGVVKLESTKGVAIGVKVLYDSDEDTGKQDVEGIKYVDDSATDKDMTWLEPWDPDYKKKLAEQVLKDIEDGKVMTEDDWIKEQREKIKKMVQGKLKKGGKKRGSKKDSG